ncbi:MAG TPA: hypothetical protein VJR23_00060, partial [Candidatus Acidoferrales bacterium]|nr:hypothetical protein [Candidatus Acidoferrales bacterium]
QKRVEKQQQQDQRQQRRTRQEQSRPAEQPRTQQAQGRQQGRHQRGDPQQVAHYEQAHFRQYQARSNERIVTVPQPVFEEHFGEEHHFHCQPVVVDGFSRFEVANFWFVLEEPWPEGWFDDDDFIVIDDGGLLFLEDLDDPGFQVQLVTVTVIG